MDRFDVTIIGAGVIGLAIARILAPRHPNLLIIEQHPQIGMETSSRNSEVIHAGIYYPTDSLKARLCVAGRQMLYDYCAQHSVPHQRIGKLIVSQVQNDQPKLETLAKQAANNGVNDLQWWDSNTLQQTEPQLQACQALYSPSTGIIDSHALMQSLLSEAESSGAILALNTQVLHINQDKNHFELDVSSAATPYRFSSRIVINAAGLGAQELASHITQLNPSSLPPLYYAKGNYFSYSGRSPFTHLIYPLPDPQLAGLGIHATLDLGGQLRFGPDAHYVDQLDYQVDLSQKDTFVAAIQGYFPTIEADKLQPAYSGIRPKLQAPGQISQDFCIQSAEQHSIVGLINLFGIESPGLTSGLALAQEVAAILHKETA